MLNSVRHLHALNVSRRPLFLISTKHSGQVTSPRTYFGTALTDASPRTYLIAFQNQQLASDVAHGLEAHRAHHGEFPQPSRSNDLTLTVTGTQGDLELLDVCALPLPEAMKLIKGSGIGISIVMDSTSKAMNITAGEIPERAWLETLLPPESPTPEPTPHSAPEPSPQPSFVNIVFKVLFVVLIALL